MLKIFRDITIEIKTVLQVISYLEPFSDKTTIIEETVQSLDSKVENLDYLNAPETCLQLVSQGINESQTLLMDPDGAKRGAIPIPLFCQLPEAVTISGGNTEIEINSQCAEPSCFTHLINYDRQTLDQLTALTDFSPQCTQSLDFNCLSTPLKDLVSLF